VLGAVFTATMSALESEGLVKTLAEPNLVAISGKTANFLSGSEYPVPTVSGTTGSVGAEYRAFGISLSFSPTVLSPTNIGLTIATEVSAEGVNVSFPVGQTTTDLPTFTVRRANTTVELPSGGSIAIAGLISSDFQDTIAGTPGIKNVPILGRLFSSTAFTRHESELVVMVTAYLIEPTDGTQKLSSPTDGLMPPSDADLYLLNHLTGIMNRRPINPPSSVARDVGYITE
jgi:pilus assembly protein CpaC